MDIEPIQRLCDPVNPFRKQVLYTYFHIKSRVNFQLRTLELPADMRWLIKWIGEVGLASVPDQQAMYDALYSGFEEDAGGARSQTLVVTANEEPRLVLSVQIETWPYQALSFKANNYVLRPLVNVMAPAMDALEPLRQAIQGCFAFKEIDRLFACLDKDQHHLSPLAEAAGFRRLDLAGLQPGNRYYEVKKYL